MFNSVNQHVCNLRPDIVALQKIVCSLRPDGKALSGGARTQPKAVYGPKPLGVDPGKKLLLLGAEKATPKLLGAKTDWIKIHFGEDGPFDFQYRYGGRDAWARDDAHDRMIDHQNMMRMIDHQNRD